VSPYMVGLLWVRLASNLHGGVPFKVPPHSSSHHMMPNNPCRHEAYDARADCWSFGVVLVELLTQQKPYVQLCLTPVQVAIQVGANCWSRQIHCLHTEAVWCSRF
jgi:hypothetical protein